jgi:hypothetical protein
MSRVAPVQFFLQEALREALSWERERKMLPKSLYVKILAHLPREGTVQRGRPVGSTQGMGTMAPHTAMWRQDEP